MRTRCEFNNNHFIFSSSSGKLKVTNYNLLRESMESNVSSETYIVESITERERRDDDVFTQEIENRKSVRTNAFCLSDWELKMK